MNYVPEYCVKDDIDVFWATATTAPRLPTKIKIVATVYDLNHILVPETMRTGTLWHQRLFFKTSLKRASAITTISHGTANRLYEHFGVRTSAVVTPGVSAVFQPRAAPALLASRRSYGLDVPYLLAVATKEPRKNLELLVRTFLAMKTEGLLRPYKLVLVGDSGWANAQLMGLLSEGRSGSVISLGYVSDHELSALYCASEALVFPSIYEGFGIPLVEAQACGTRIVATDLPELREAGGPRTLYVPTTEEGIRTGIMTCLAEPRPAPVDRGKLPTWTTAAHTLSEVFKHLTKEQLDDEQEADLRCVRTRFVSRREC
jgi:glycosyltransferase involved in cell wall biosynthesis